MSRKKNNKTLFSVSGKLLRTGGDQAVNKKGEEGNLVKAGPVVSFRALYAICAVK